MSAIATIPAAVLEQLGGLQEGDAPVLVALTGPVFGIEAWHPPTEGAMKGAHRLILPASAPALLCVLARFVGLTLEVGEVPRFDCPACDYHSVRRGDVNRHYETQHRGSKPHACLLCGYRAHQRVNLVRHVAAKHRLDLALGCNWPGCVCRFETEHERRRHRRIHVRK